MRSNTALLASVFAPALVALAAWLIVPQFVTLLAQFGELPWTSRIVLATYRWWWLVPVAIAGMLAATGLHRTRPQRVVLAVNVLTGGLVAIMLLGLYAPIHSLANAVAG